MISTNNNDDDEKNNIVFCLCFTYLYYFLNYFIIIHYFFILFIYIIFEIVYLSLIVNIYLFIFITKIQYNTIQYKYYYSGINPVEFRGQKKNNKNNFRKSWRQQVGDLEILARAGSGKANQRHCGWGGGEGDLRACGGKLQCLAR